MAGTFNNQRTSFASGEVTPNIRAANDLARFQTGGEIVENLVVMIEAILTRRPGTRFVLDLANRNEAGKMVPFRYSGGDYYVLGFNGGVMRVLKDGGVLESSPGVIYELAVPWLEADMANLRTAAAGNIQLQVAAGKTPQKLTRLGHTNWTIGDFAPLNGPVDAQNLNAAITIQIAATTGAGIALTGVGNPLLAGHVGGVFRLDEPSQSSVPLWSANEAIVIGNLRRWQENVYQALTNGNTGLNAPVHTEGDTAAGVGNVTWRYLHSGYGFVRITAVTNGNSATCDVLSYVPDSVVAAPTYRWWPPAWCDAVGWPKQVSTHDQRAYFARDNVYWMTSPPTIDDFQVTALDDSAIARRLVAPDGSYVEIEWVLSSGVLVQGTRDFEWLTRPPGDNDALTNANVRDIPDEAQGSAPQVPALVDKGAVFIGKSGTRIHYVRFTRLAQELSIQEISVASRHMFGVGAAQVVWQRDPHRLLWIRLNDGSLACGTFMPDEKIIGFTRCPMENCFLEDMAVSPSQSNGRSDVYLQTRRYINGEYRRYYEILTPFFEPANPAAPTAEGAWFVDCGLRYAGPPVARVMGAGHLIGQTVVVFVDGAEQTRKVVAGDGGVTLDPVNMAAASIDVVIGLPIKWQFRDLPRDVTLQGQTSKGMPKRASHIAIDVRNAAGGTVSYNGSNPQPLTKTGTINYSAPIPLFTGSKSITVASSTKDEGAIELIGDNAMPFTLLAITPLIEVEDPT